MDSGPTVVGGQQLAKLANELKLVAGGQDIRRELYKEIRKIPRPLIKKIRAHSRETLPSRGGLAAEIATATYRTKITSRASIVRADLNGFKTKDSGRIDVEAIDRGRLRHPVYGRGRWVNQTVTPGFFTKPTEESADDLRKAVVNAMDAVIQRIS